MWKSKTKRQETEATRKDFNIVLTRQDKKFFILELFKVIQDAIPLILHYRTMCWFWTVSSSTFIILDVQSIYLPSQIQDWYQEDKIWARKDRQYSLRLWIPWTRNTKIRTSLIWPHHVLHDTSRKRGEDQDTVYWVDQQVAQRKVLKFYQTTSNAIILYDTLLAYCIPKVVVMDFGEIIYKKVYMSPQLPPKISKITGWKN